MSCVGLPFLLACQSHLSGFYHAGATADAFTLFERLESQLETHPGAHCVNSMTMQSSPLCHLLNRKSVHAGQLKRAAVELAKLWRLDKYLRRLDVRLSAIILRLRFCINKPISPHLPVTLPSQATMVVADAKESLTITGNGDVVEPHDGVIGESASSCSDHSFQEDSARRC